MCGIVAVYGKMTNTLMNVFKELFIVDQVRGVDSCGVAGLHNHGVSIVKDIYDPVTVMSTKRFDKLEKRGDLYGVIGHNRYRTKGDITAENAHPFNHGSITGVHNGTIPWTGDLPDNKNFEVDSENLIYAIDKVGIEKTWHGLGYSGAASVVYHDSKTKSLNLISNGKRPLFFAYTEDNSAILVASESWMIRAIAHRNQVKLAKAEGGSEIYSLADDMLHTFTQDKKGIHLKLHKIPEKKIIGYSYRAGKEEDDHMNDAWWDRRQAAIAGFRQENKPEVKNLIPSPTKKVGMTEADFTKRYPFCGGCGKDMCDQFKDAVVLDLVTAICGECGEVATEKKQEIAGAHFTNGNSLVH